MAKKGQTCLTCDATCCRVHLYYNLKEGHRKLKRFLHHSRKEILLHYDEIIPGYLLGKDPCPALTLEGLCGQQHHKPRLCRSWWCGRKTWKPKGYYKELEDRDHTEHGISALEDDGDPSIMWYYCEDCEIYLGYKTIEKAK